MAPRCGLEGVLGSSWGRPGGVLRPSWGHPGGVLGVTVAKLALRGLREAVLRGSATVPEVTWRGLRGVGDAKMAPRRPLQERFHPARPVSLQELPSSL